VWSHVAQSNCNSTLRWFTCAGPTFPSNERTSCDKLFDVLSSAEKRQTTSCMVDREFAISRHATGQPVLLVLRGFKRSLTQPVPTLDLYLTAPRLTHCPDLCCQHTDSALETSPGQQHTDSCKLVVTSLLALRPADCFVSHMCRAGLCCVLACRMSFQSTV
jgi:hypothetical protein